jgi:hypothetical protein
MALRQPTYSSVAARAGGSTVKLQFSEIRASGLRAAVAVAGVVGAIAAPLPANAAIVSLCGPNICYEYDNNPGVNAGITLFGAPTLLSGSDTLEFTPTAFSASAVNGGIQTTTATFQFSRVYSLSGAEIVSFTVNESGDYRIINGGTVSASLRLQSVDKVNNGLGGSFPEVTVSSPIPNWNTSTPTGLVFQNWSLSASLTPAATFQDLASVVDLQIQNTLDAFTFASGQQAFIQKKLTLVTSVVPVPAAVWLFGSALAGIGFLRRRAA